MPRNHALTIRAKTLLLTSLLLVCSLTLTYFVARKVVSQEVAPLETRQTRDRLRTVDYLLRKNINDLEKWAIDWGNWDETYQFMLTGSPRYVAVNLTPAYFKAYDIEHLLFVTPQGRVRYASTYDFSALTQRAVSPPLLQQLLQVAAREASRTPSEVTSGIFRSDGRFFTVAARHILTSKGEGPSRGVLVFANELEPAELTQLGQVAGNPISLVPFSDPRITPQTRTRLQRLTTATPRMAQIRNDTTIDGFQLLTDLLTGQKLVIAMAAPRSIHEEGQRMTGYFTGSFLAVGALLITGTVLLLGTTVLGPLRKLSDSVARLDFASADQFIHEPRGKELNTLARAINEALSRLILARAEAERANAAKGEFLATMSHELRTPLNAILGYSELLREQDAAMDDRERDEALLNIERSGRHLLALVNDVLDLSKIESGALELHSEEIPLESFCDACLQFLQTAARAKQIAISCSRDNAPSHFYADRRRMKQVMINLLGNAVKFTPPGGQVGLEVITTVEGELSFTVWDTGIGIGPEDRERLFRPFTQLDSGLSRNHEGTGLGLSVVQRLVHLHGGRITVASEEGLGSRFTVTIPLLSAREEIPSPDNGPLPADSPPQEPAQTLEREAPLILLAEDNDTAFQMVAQYLGREGYRIMAATTGEDAVTGARTARPDLILMDIQMPGLSGLDAIARIRALPPPAGGVPIVVLTALGMPEDRERSLAAGADDYLTKPIRLKELSGHVAGLLAERRAPSPHPRDRMAPARNRSN